MIMMDQPLRHRPTLHGPIDSTQHASHAHDGSSIVLVSKPKGGIPSVTSTARGFADALDDLAAADGPMAVDAERASVYRYSRGDYLIQVRRAGTATYLLDIPALKKDGADLTELSSRMPHVEWILHDGSEDLPSFRDLGLKVPSLFDTEFAARMLGLSRPGLAHCTEYYLGLSLAKEHAAADWSYRPLPLDWRNYAALDVELLIQLRHAMVADLRRQGKLEWAQQEFAHILAEGMAPAPDDPEPWRHTSHINALGSDRRSLAVVRSLWQARDRLAQRLDIAPTLLLRDADMVLAARLKPHNKRQFEQISCLNERVRIDADNDDQNRMFARYIPLQEKVRPSVWRRAIIKALKLPIADLPSASGPQERTGTAVPRSMKFWRLHQPNRYVRLMAMRRTLSAIAQDVRMPVELLVRPQLIRQICWDKIAGEQIAGFLAAHDARPWQIDLVASSLAGITIQGLR